MSAVLGVQPQGRTGPSGLPIEVHPGQGVIKEERKCVVWRERLPDGTAAVLKLYRHRPPRLSERLGLYTGRAEREFRALSHLHEHGVACSEPLFHATGNDPAHGRYELLATREVPGAVDLRAWFAADAQRSMPDLAALYGLVAEAHRAGLQHGALLDRNVLWDGRRFWLIDLPRHQIFAGSILGRRLGHFDVLTLTNSLVPKVPEATLVQALSAYGHLPAAPTEIVRRLRAHPLRDSQLNALHMLFTLWALPARFLRRTPGLGHRP
jgi:tRNA A-37 threonylcarbamoyl transferase component Bud32